MIEKTHGNIPSFQSVLYLFCNTKRLIIYRAKLDAGVDNTCINFSKLNRIQTLVGISKCKVVLFIITLVRMMRLLKISVLELEACKL